MLASNGVCTDSRTLQAGNLFVALRGANFNGNLFAAQALEQGAIAAVTDTAPAAPDPRYVVVHDTLQALQMLAAQHRRYLDIPIVAVTGTNGKTTTKELMANVLAKKYKTAATQGNLNNHIGLPLTLLSMDKSTEIGVVEMGANHPNEIAALCNIAQPNAGLITNVGKAHLEGFGSFENIKKTKGELYDYLIAHQGHIFAWDASPHLLQMLHERNAKSLSLYGENAEQKPVSAHNNATPYWQFLYKGTPVSTHLVGSYNAPNVWAAMAVGKHFGVAEADILEAIAAYQPANNRSQWVSTARNHIIVDAYNANPTSMAAAIDNFAVLAKGNKVAILGEMLELGAASDQEHKAIVQRAQQAGFEQIFWVGKCFAEWLQGTAHLYFDTVEELATHLTQHPLQGCQILVKGSHDVHLEKILPLL
ncbi:UDP-N-acetylmuramoyl-tripeptide--D-alanyl-D-alanine ligase [Bacteroidia bacterium]|nr:UDP-N-acetylmuramoyl-tripeptide--D-alanyl-D-alanine ligase [Bacteroidia bacterium]